MNKKAIITALLALIVTTSIVAQDLIKITTDSLMFGDINKRSRNQIIYQFPTIKMGNLQIDNYPMIVEDAMSEFICNRFDGVIGFNLVGKGLSFKLDTKDSLLIVTDRKICRQFAEK